MIPSPSKITCASPQARYDAQHTCCKEVSDTTSCFSLISVQSTELNAFLCVPSFVVVVIVDFGIHFEFG